MPFLRNVPSLEAIYRDYAQKDVQLFIIYKSVVHPGTNGIVEAFTIQERLGQIAMAKEQLKTTVPWLCDTLQGDLAKALKSAPNAEFIVSADGRLLSKKFWHDPAALRAFLAEKVGPVDKPTRVEDLGMQLEFAKAGAPRGIVKPMGMSGRMAILKTTPEMPQDKAEQEKMTPFFAKLLAEGDRELLQRGKGKLYFGFYIDPLYKVHWNNPAGGLSYTIEQPGNPDFEPITGKAPEYEHEADVDPREFLFDFEAPKRGAKFRVTVRYTICDDNGKFCIPIEQHYELELAGNPTHASRSGDWMTELVGDPLQYDKNKDGKVTRGELPPGRAQIILLHHDRNHDDTIDEKEAALFHDMIRIKPGETGR